MQVTPIKTRRVEPNSTSLTQLLDESISELSEGSILVITSKVVSLCEGDAVSQSDTDRDDLIKSEADKYLLPEHSRYGHHFTIANYTLIASAGIDASNAADQYVLWPRDPQKTAYDIRQYLADRFGLEDVGVIITDSTCQPLRRGTSGIALSHAGFKGINNYVGKPDLFGHVFKVTYASVSGGLAAAAVVTMGEGTEQTPLCVLGDLPFVTFDAAAPDTDEIEVMRIQPNEDLFAPFLEAVDWQDGNGHATPKS